MASNSSLQRRIENALEAIPPHHKLPPSTGETVDSLEAGKIRLQDYAFTKGFALVVDKNDKKRNFLILECSRHKKKTKNWRKLEEGERRRAATNVSFNTCEYSVKIRYHIQQEAFIITVINDEHNHSMAFDPFIFREHKSRDNLRDEALQLGLGMRKSSTKYSQAKRTLQTQGLNMSYKEYYNLIRSKGRKTPEEQLVLALKCLEEEGFHVRCQKKYQTTDNVRQKEIIEHFFFCHPIQIQYARRFVSGFAIQTDATFNTNHLNMLLSLLLGVTNTLKSFSVAYCYVSSESSEAFMFINACLQDLYFYDDCPGPAVIIGDFSAGLSSAMLQRQKTSRSDAGMDIATELEQTLDSVGSEVKLQLCSWHAAEAVKKRLINEGYPKDIRVMLVDLIWKWINASTMKVLMEAKE